MLAARHRARLAMADKNPDSQEAKLRSVRRRLNFGEANDDKLPSREELERQFAEERARHLEEKKAKWNFDFKEERPLQGQWEWERVEEDQRKSETRSSDRPAAVAVAVAAAPESADASAERATVDAGEQAR